MHKPVWLLYAIMSKQNFPQQKKEQQNKWFANPRIEDFGNPKLYGGWKDETLNCALRTAGMFAHRANLEMRIFTLFDLQGGLLLDGYLFGEEFVP